MFVLTKYITGSDFEEYTVAHIFKHLQMQKETLKY